MLKRSARIFRGSKTFSLVDRHYYCCCLNRGPVAGSPHLLRKDSVAAVAVSLSLQGSLNSRRRQRHAHVQHRQYWGSSLLDWISHKVGRMQAGKRPLEGVAADPNSGLENGAKKAKAADDGADGGSAPDLPPAERIKTELGLAGKTNDLGKALELFDLARKENYPLNQKSCQVILHLLSGGEQWMEKLQQSSASQAGGAGAGKEAAAQAPAQGGADLMDQAKLLNNRDKELYLYMKAQNVEFNEFVYTGLARIAAITGNPEGAFEIAKNCKLKGSGKNKARLRTLAPALFGFCFSDRVEKAMEVENEMKRLHLQLTEVEYRIILAAIVRTGNVEYGNYVLECMLREITKVNAETSEIVATFFRTYHERTNGAVKGDSEVLRKYSVSTEARVAADGLCSACGEKLEKLDLKEMEMKTLAKKIADLALKRETKNESFRQFTDWVDRNGPFDIIIDGANIGFFGQAKGGVFTFMQIMSLHEKVKKVYPNKKPLIVLHTRRVKHFEKISPRNKQMVEVLKRNRELFATPQGSNDDWYWIYAAVLSGRKGMLVTNDEMRDHIFQTLESKNFNRWKLCHQMRFQIYDTVTLHPPGLYTECIQRKQSHWHFPIYGERTEKEFQPITHYLCARQEEEEEPGEIKSN